MKGKKIAIIADWLIDFGGAELVISHLLEMFPEADIFTSVCYMNHPMLEGRKVYTSWIQHIPFFNRKHKLAGLLRPWAFRSFDLSEYDVIISSSSAESKNAGYSKRKAGVKHICYCHTPTRYYWSHAKEYEEMMEFGYLNPLVKFIFPLVRNWMKRVDYRASKRVDYFIANSKNTAERIRKYYNRDAEVIYPGVEVSPNREELSEGQDHEPYYLGLGRCIPYKRFDLLVDAFNTNGKKLILCTATDTKLYHELKGKSKPNIEWKFRVSNEEKIKLMAKAKAFLFPPLEDFGLVPVEAMSLGTPIIAYGKGGATESIVEGKTGIFFSTQTPEELNTAITSFEGMTWNKTEIQKHAKNFSKEVFIKSFGDFLSRNIGIQ
ncbi:MAG: glycosyltransferase family 4 protein [Candidatus Altimarinota bacterium]